MPQSLLLTNRELEVIDKKLKHKKLTQQDSNYLSRYVRPKLREMATIGSSALLRKLDYNQKTPSIEKKIKNLILKNVKNVSAILIYGSAVYNNYSDYNDIDVLVVVNKKSWEKLGEKFLLINQLTKNTNLDLKIYEEKELIGSYPSNITLIYELSDSRVIYGKLELPKKRAISLIDIKMKIDDSLKTKEIIEENGLEYVSGKELYSAIRNLCIINLISDGIIDNNRLNNLLNILIGKATLGELKQGNDLEYKKIGHIILDKLLEATEKRIRTWEKSRILVH